MCSTRWGRAFEAWRKILGAAQVLAGEAVGPRYLRCTLPSGRRVAGVLRPGSVEEVQALVRVAAALSVPLYPISTGKNWGYGTALPVGEDQVVVDLGRLNRIVELDPQLAYAVLEPGVTQGQLHAQLEAQGLPLMLSPTGSSPSCSVLANTLERGFGATPGGRHVYALCSLEVVMPDGSLLRTGYGHYPEARARYVYEHGIGPALDGLFCQSNLGIVVRMGVHLERKPEAVSAFYGRIADEAALCEVLERARELRFRGIVQGPMNLVSRLRSCAMVQNRKELEQSGSQAGRLPEWTLAGALSGPPELVAASKRLVRKALRGPVRGLVFLNRRLLRFCQRHPRLFAVGSGLDPQRTLPLLEKSLGLFEGVPSEISMPLCYWRARVQAPGSDIDPAADGCGLSWYAPITPNTGQDAAHLLGLARTVFLRHGLDFLPTITVLSARALAWTMPVLFDRTDPKERALAQACHRDLVAAGRSAGYWPYRTGIDGMGEVVGEAGDAYWRWIGRLKEAVDPGGILAPGRYCPIPAVRPRLASGRAARAEEAETLLASGD